MSMFTQARRHSAMNGDGARKWQSLCPSTTSWKRRSGPMRSWPGSSGTLTSKALLIGWDGQAESGYETSGTNDEVAGLIKKFPEVFIGGWQ